MGDGLGGAKPLGWFYKLRRSHEGSSLTKHVTRAWSKRYFVLSKDKLKWYTSADPYSGKAPNGFVNFQQILKIRILHSESRLEDVFNRDEFGTFSIEVDSNKRRLVLRTPSREDAKFLVNELRARMEIWTDRDGTETLKEISKISVFKRGDATEHTLREIDSTIAMLSARQEEEEKAEREAPRPARKPKVQKLKSKKSSKRLVKKSSSSSSAASGLKSSSKQPVELGDEKAFAAPDSSRGVVRKSSRRKLKTKGGEDDVRRASVPKKKSSSDAAVERRASKAAEVEHKFSDEEQLPKPTKRSTGNRRRKEEKVSENTDKSEALFSRLQDHNDVGLSSDSDEDLRESLGLQTKKKTSSRSKPKRSSSPATREKQEANIREEICEISEEKAQEPNIRKKHRSPIQNAPSTGYGTSIQADENWLEEDFDQ